MLTGAILAGGDSRRMDGKLKALLPFHGQPLIIRQIQQMQAICDEMIVVTNDPRPYLPVVDRSVRIIADYFPVGGPLAGLHASLSLARHSSIWAVGCDMPFLSAQAARLLWKRQQEGYEAAVPLIDGGVYPLHGVYDRGCTGAVEQLLQQGATHLSALLSRIRWAEVEDRCFEAHGIAPVFTRTIKTHADYERSQREEQSLSELAPMFKELTNQE